jgi:imidazolonepropionase-like amidohydrolase
MEGLVAATANGGRALGLETVGVVVPGGPADIVVVDGDPLADPRILLDRERTWLVLRAGQSVAGRALDGSGPAWDARRPVSYGDRDAWTPSPCCR